MDTQGQKFIEMLGKNRDLTNYRIKTALLIAELHEQAISENFNPVTDSARMYNAFKALEEQYATHPLYRLPQNVAITILIPLLDEYIHSPCDWSNLFSAFSEEVYMKGRFTPASFINPILEDRSLFRAVTSSDISDGKEGDFYHFTASDLLVVEAIKFVPYISNYIRLHTEAKFHLTARDEFELKLLGRIFADCPNVRYSIPQKHASDGVERKYGLVLAAPDLCTELFYRSEFGRSASDTVALQYLLQCITPGGTLVIAVGNATALRGGATARLRNLIERNYRIFAIAQSEYDLYTLLIINNTQPKNDETVQIMDYTISSKGWRFENIEHITQSRLAEMEEWNLKRYRSISSISVKKYFGSSVPKVPFKTIADIFRGVTVRSEDISNDKSIPEGSVAIVEISNLKMPEISIGRDREYRFTQPTSIRLDEKRLPYNYLKKGDILLAARGAMVRTAIVRDIEIPSVASANILVIRPYPDNIKSECLKIFFDSKYGQEMLQGITYGHSLITISYKDLQNLDIPLPPIEVQKRIALAYTNEYTFFSSIIDIAQSRWENAKQALVEDLLSPEEPHWNDDSPPLLENIISILEARNS